MRRRSATWTACCRPRTSRAPMPSSSVGRPRRTYPSRVCQRRACTSCSPARRPIRRCTRPSRPMRGGPCANTSGTRTSMPRTAPCRAASPCSRWAAPARRTRRWCSTIWPWRTASINPCMAVMSKAISTPMASPGGDRVPAGLRRQYPASAAPQDLRGADRQRGQPGLVAGGAQARRGRRPFLDRGAARESLGRARRRGGIPGRAPCDLGRAGGQDRGGQVIRRARGAARLVHGDIR